MGFHGHLLGILPARGGGVTLLVAKGLPEALSIQGLVLLDLVLAELAHLFGLLVIEVRTAL